MWSVTGISFWSLLAKIPKQTKILKENQCRMLKHAVRLIQQEHTYAACYGLFNAKRIVENGSQMASLAHKQSNFAQFRSQLQQQPPILQPTPHLSLIQCCTSVAHHPICVSLGGGGVVDLCLLQTLQQIVHQWQWRQLRSAVGTQLQRRINSIITDYFSHHITAI